MFTNCACIKGLYSLSVGCNRLCQLYTQCITGAHMWSSTHTASQVQLWVNRNIYMYDHVHTRYVARWNSCKTATTETPVDVKGGGNRSILQCISHTHTHTHTHTQTYTHTRIHTHVYTHTYTHMYTHTHVYTHKYTHIYTETHTHTHTQTHTGKGGGAGMCFSSIALSDSVWHYWLVRVHRYQNIPL